MHKGIFTNESQFNNCLLESSQLGTQVANWGGARDRYSQYL